MLNKLSNFYKTNKYVIWWTVGYFITTWAIMRYMFNFDIFSRIRWWQLMHAHIRGFAGFVFGILILAAIPMYIATTVVIARTKAPLFSIKIPEFVKKAFIQTPIEEPAPETTQSTEEHTETQTPTKPPVPETVPSEMRVAYARARDHVSRTQTSAFDLSNLTKSQSGTNTAIPEPQAVEKNEMPIPTDFDIDDINDIVNSVPTFTDINFDDDDEEIEITDTPELTNISTPVTEYMESKSVPYTVDDDVVITNNFAIVSHTDQEFWIADNESWFAAGKTRKSPIELVKRIANKHNVQPVLYLGANNIMDIKTLVPPWENDGIRVVTDLKDLK